MIFTMVIIATVVNYYASVGEPPEAYSSRFVYVCVIMIL